MDEKNILLKPIKEISKKQVFTTSPLASVRDIANFMKEKNISGIVVSENNLPIGIITDRDFRNKVVSKGLVSDNIKAHEIMSGPVMTIHEEDYIFEAVYKMTKNNIHRLVVVDDMGRIAGIVTDTDIIKLQTNTPFYFIRDLEYANRFDDLKILNDKTTAFVNFLMSSKIKTVEIIRFISHINDSLIKKCIELVLRDNYFDLPEDFAFLVLGSEGRREQTLKTDQDNAIVYDDVLDNVSIDKIKTFSEKLIEALIYIGIPECPGGIMAKNSFWRRSLIDWKQTLTKWISVPTPENILNYSMFSDLRTLYGMERFELELKELIKELVAKESLFLAHMAKNVLRFPPPIGFLGNIKTEKEGKYKGKLDIKKAVIFPITEGVKILCLEEGIISGTTVEKINRLMELNLMPKSDLLELETSFIFAVNLRLKSQLNEISRNEIPSNYIDVKRLNHIEMDRLKIALSVVKTLQSFLSSKFNLSFIS
jgi:CBS domain-containing protein